MEQKKKNENIAFLYTYVRLVIIIERAIAATQSTGCRQYQIECQVTTIAFMPDSAWPDEAISAVQFSDRLILLQYNAVAVERSW